MQRVPAEEKFQFVDMSSETAHRYTENNCRVKNAFALEPLHRIVVEVHCHIGSHASRIIIKVCKWFCVI